MVHPTVRAAWLLGAGFPMALLPAVVDERLWLVWAVVVGASLLAIVVDALWIVASRRLHAEVHVPAEVELGTPAACRVALRLDRGSAAIELLADFDEQLEPPPPTTVALTAPDVVEVHIPLVPRRRGTFALRRLWFRWRGPLGLVGRTTQRPLDEPVRVVPDIRGARQVALQFFGSRSTTHGLKIERYLGDGSEFESLRQYVPGLDPRSVDWKASARHRKLLCRRFRAERDHQVVIAIDCGHMMSEPLDGVPRVDHAIHRGLALAYLGLRTGDRVGLYAFDARPRAFVEPQGGTRAFARLRHRSAEIEYGTAATNFALGMLDLTRRLKRRSLVVVFTEFVDAVTAELMLDHIARLARRHLIVFVSLRDPGLERLELDVPDALSDVHRAVVASGLRNERELVFERLRRAGVQVIDALPSQATARLLNRYLEIKRREMV